MQKLMRFAIATPFLGLLLMPGISSAQVISQLQAQVSALTAQLQNIQQELANGENAPGDGRVLGASTSNIFAPNFGFGSESAEVTLLQKFLIAQGYLKLSTTTDYFGSATENALKAFQSANGISPTGYFGVETAAAANAIVAATATAVAPATATIASTQTSTSTISTLNYFINTHNETLFSASSGPVSQTVKGQMIYLVKWANTFYVTYSYDNNYIYLKEDHSDSPDPPYTFSDGKWLALNMQIGQQINVSDNQIQYYNATSCAPTTSGALPYVNTLLQEIPNDNLGGNLGVQDVIVLKYDYSAAAGRNVYEEEYYAKGWGLVEWQLWENDQIAQSVAFNQISSQAPTAPDLAVNCSPPITSPSISVPTSSLNFSAYVGANPAAQTLTVKNIGTGTLTWQATSTSPWLTITGNQSTGLLTVAVNSSNLSAGTYSGTVTIASNDPVHPTIAIPATVMVTVPAMPTSLSGFVGTLYACVLNNNNPGSSGINFWLGDLETHALTIQGAYADFFGYQNGVTPPITNSQFTQKLYACILFYPVDTVSYNNVMVGLANGTLTQAGLVQTVLNSSVFTTDILPKLQALK
jgi:peptidoglycan hydrolase-like protein with peptidoglycan-binding domain